MATAKFFLTFFEILLVIALIVFIGLIVLVKFNNKTVFGQIVKREVLHFPALVNLIGLNEPGDNKALYLLGDDSEIKVHIYYSENLAPDKKADLWIQAMISQTTDKKVNVERKNLDSELVANETGDTELTRLRSNLVPRFSGTPDLYIVYLAKYKEMPTSVGVVLHRDTIFIFKSTLDSLTENILERQKLEQSTLMHEWGHVLGLEHTSNPKCIMSERVDVYQEDAWLHEIETTYCKETLDAVLRYQTN